MTAKPVVPRERAILDVQEAVDHYLTTAGVTTALGLIAALHSAYGHIARHPASGSPGYAHELGLPGLRFKALRRYPYLVFYVEREDMIDVWRVLHTARDIPAWMSQQD